MTLSLYKCPLCERIGFTAIGLRNHRCGTETKRQLTREEWTNAIADQDNQNKINTKSNEEENQH